MRNLTTLLQNAGDILLGLKVLSRPKKDGGIIAGGRRGGESNELRPMVLGSRRKAQTLRL